MVSIGKVDYTRRLLQQRIRTNKKVADDEHFAVLAECLKAVNAKAVKENYKTKEQLYALGFNAFQIQKYFIFINVSDFERESCWILKPGIKVDETYIKNINDLINILKINLQLAS